MSNIECKDAILDLTDPENPREPTWPKVDYIIGNPPFLGGKMLRRELGDKVVDALFEVWRERVPREADLCVYWFEKARGSIEGRGAARVGLLATQGIRGGANREVLERISRSGGIFWGWSDREWVLDGAAVHVSMVGFDDGRESLHSLDGQLVPEIHPDLTAGVPTSQAQRIEGNLDVSFMGDTKGGPFDLPYAEGVRLLLEPNPHGRPNSDVVVPWCNGLDLARRPREMFIVDFGTSMSEAEASLYSTPWARVEKLVQPARSKNKRAT